MDQSSNDGGGDDDLPSVNPFSSGDGLPYAPQDWPNPGDTWSWSVRERCNKQGFFNDRYLHPPQHLQETHGVKLFSSRISVDKFIRKKFPNVDVEAFFASFNWKIPKAKPSSMGSMRLDTSVEEKVGQDFNAIRNYEPWVWRKNALDLISIKEERPPPAEEENPREVAPPAKRDASSSVAPGQTSSSDSEPPLQWRRVSQVPDLEPPLQRRRVSQAPTSTNAPTPTVNLLALPIAQQPPSRSARPSRTSPSGQPGSSAAEGALEETRALLRQSSPRKTDPDVTTEKLRADLKLAQADASKWKEEAERCQAELESVRSKFEEDWKDLIKLVEAVKAAWGI